LPRADRAAAALTRVTRIVRRPPERFARVLEARAVLALWFGAMIGWSWVLMTRYSVANAGSVGTLVAFVGGGLVLCDRRFHLREFVANSSACVPGGRRVPRA